MSKMINACVSQLREEHFSRPHSDMVGDEEERRGYLNGIKALADALKATAQSVWIYVNASKQVGDPDHLKVFETEAAAGAWFAANDPEGVAFGYEITK